MRAQELRGIKIVPLSGATSEDDNLYGGRVTTQHLRDIQSIPAAHEQVRDHEIGGNLAELAESCLTIVRTSVIRHPAFFQHLPKADTDLLIVGNDENRARMYVEVLQGATSRVMEVLATAQYVRSLEPSLQRISR